MNWMNQIKWEINNVERTELSEWLRDCKQVFQLKETRLSIKRNEVNYVITLKKLKSKSSFLILTKSEK